MGKRTLLTLSIILFSVLSLSACQSRPLAESNVIATPTPSTEAVASPVAEGKKKANYEFTATESGKTALSLLEGSAAIETKDYGTAGKFVTSINDLPATNEYYWAFYVNGTYAEKGASQTTLQKGDTIKFVYEAVSTTK
jgi:hypothetical protein